MNVFNWLLLAVPFIGAFAVIRGLQAHRNENPLPRKQDQDDQELRVRIEQIELAAVANRKRFRDVEAPDQGSAPETSGKKSEPKTKAKRRT